MDDLGPDLHAEGRRAATSIALVFGGFMQCVVGVFVLFSGLLAPPWGVAVLAVVWVTGAVGLWQLRHRALLALVVPLVTAGVVLAVLQAGDAWLGWTA